MAENKKSFLLYADLIHTVKKMPKEKAGELLLTILSYVNDENPVVDDLMVDLVFEPIKHQLKRDLQRYEGIKAKRAENGRAGGLKSGEVRKQTEANEANGSIKEANEAVNVTVTDTVTVNDNEIKEGPIQKNNLDIVFTIEHCVVVALNDERWVRVNKTNKQELEEFNRVLEKRGHYQKNPMDYKTHFANWKATGKKDLPKNESPPSGPSPSELRALEILKEVG